MKICHRCNENNTTTNPSAPELNTWNCQRWKPEVAMYGAVVECRTRDPEVPRFKALCKTIRKSLRGLIRTIPPTNSNCTRVKYLKLSEVKTRSCLWHSGRLQDYRSRGPQFKPQCKQKENLSQVQSEQYCHHFLCTRVKYLKLSEVKMRSLP